MYDILDLVLPNRFSMKNESVVMTLSLVENLPSKTSCSVMRRIAQSSFFPGRGYAIFVWEVISFCFDFSLILVISLEFCVLLFGSISFWEYTLVFLQRFLLTPHGLHVVRDINEDLHTGISMHRLVKATLQMQPPVGNPLDATPSNGPSVRNLQLGIPSA